MSNKPRKLRFLKKYFLKIHHYKNQSKVLKESSNYLFNFCPLKKKEDQNNLKSLLKIYSTSGEHSHLVLSKC